MGLQSHTKITYSIYCDCVNGSGWTSNQKEKEIDVILEYIQHLIKRHTVSVEDIIKSLDYAGLDSGRT